MTDPDDGAPEVRHQLGTRLRAARKARKLSLAAVQDESGGRLTALAVGSWERGDRNITVPRLLELAAFYGTDAASLLPGGRPVLPSGDLICLAEARDHLRQADALLGEAIGDEGDTT